MTSHCHSAAREGFAHQRARLLFSTQPNLYPSANKTTPEGRSSPPKLRRHIVREGLDGFVPESLQ